jgi:hypothetical protein
VPLPRGNHRATPRFARRPCGPSTLSVAVDLGSRGTQHDRHRGDLRRLGCSRSTRHARSAGSPRQEDRRRRLRYAGAILTGVRAEPLGLAWRSRRIARPRSSDLPKWPWRAYAQRRGPRALRRRSLRFRECRQAVNLQASVRAAGRRCAGLRRSRTRTRDPSSPAAVVRTLLRWFAQFAADAYPRPFSTCTSVVRFSIRPGCPQPVPQTGLRVTPRHASFTRHLWRFAVPRRSTVLRRGGCRAAQRRVNPVPNVWFSR